MGYATEKKAGFWDSTLGRVVRWAALLPAVFASEFLFSLICRSTVDAVVLSWTSGSYNGGIVAELIGKGAGTAVGVCTAAAVAPFWKRRVSYILAAIVFFVYTASAFLRVADGQWMLGIEDAVLVAGAVIGALLVAEEEGFGNL